MKTKEHIERVKNLIGGLNAIEDIKEEFCDAEEYVETLEETTDTLLEMMGREINWAIDEHDHRGIQS